VEACGLYSGGGIGNEPWVLRQSILVVVTTMTVGIHCFHFAEHERTIATSSASVVS
jgi:hypothetical protein